MYYINSIYSYNIILFVMYIRKYIYLSIQIKQVHLYYFIYFIYI